MPFTETLWKDIEPIYRTVIGHPFNVELAAGTLNRDAFKRYIRQDELYIVAYSRALSILAAKAPDMAEMNILLGFAKEGYEIEHALHEVFFKEFAIEPALQMSPACLAYSSFLLATVSTRPYAVGLAALLPCFDMYGKVGLQIASCAIPENPYASWIATYTGDDFARQIEQMKQLVNSAAEAASEETRSEMRTVCRYSAELEYRFWDGAYQGEAWCL